MTSYKVGRHPVGGSDRLRIAQAARSRGVEVVCTPDQATAHSALHELLNSGDIALFTAPRGADLQSLAQAIADSSADGRQRVSFVGEF